MNLDSIKTRIAKLLAMAEGTKNQFEADSFMTKVNALLEEHQIELNEIRAMHGSDNDPMGKQQGETNLYASIKWARDVAGALARFYGCQFVYWRKGNHFTYDIIGRESARVTFELMLPFVITQTKLQAKKCFADDTFGARTLPVWEREVGQALYSRIWGLVPKAEERRDELTKNALVPVNDVQAFMDDEYGELKKAQTLKLSYGRAACDAADKVSLNVQTTHTKTKRIQ